MAKVIGIGGVFFKSKDPAALGAWYRERMGMDVEPWGGVKFAWNRVDGAGAGCTVWSPFAADTKYFEPSDKPFMLNLRVDDLDGLLAQLREAGARVLDRREDSPEGKFGYVVDPDGNLLELWEPSDDDSSAPKE
jgi:predicted enzyme related to lactoylglutathione lyase